MIDFFELNMKILQYNMFAIMGLMAIIFANGFIKGIIKLKQST